MVKTKAELGRKALQVLQVLGRGQQVSPEDAELLEETIVSTMELLEGKGIVALTTYVNADEIPLAAFLPLARIVAYQCASDFGVAGGDLAGIKLLADDAELDLRAMQDTDALDEEPQGEYF